MLGHILCILLHHALSHKIYLLFNPPHIHADLSIHSKLLSSISLDQWYFF